MTLSPRISRSILLCGLVAALSACAVAPIDHTAPSDNAAVVKLLETAQQQTQQTQYNEAAATLERALRIEPRNAALWQALARVRLQQGQPEQAASLAVKSNALAETDRIRAGNWRLIGEAALARGDTAGADQAFNKAAALEHAQ